jgi:hypothetical protein
MSLYFTQDEEDGYKWGNKSTSPVSLDMNYLGAYNNNAELHAMQREMGSRYSTDGARAATANSGGSAKRGSIADTFRRGSAGSGSGGRMRALKPLGTRQAAPTAPQEEELPSGNCVVM